MTLTLPILLSLRGLFMHQILDKIDGPEDLKKLSVSELPLLAQEVRSLIVEVMSTNSGHLGASLGAVELAIGVHYCFEAPLDSVVWDVGHQAYAHKILTDRKSSFGTVRQLDGISGFPSRRESKYDDFGTGHSSTSISAVLGMACAKKIEGDPSATLAIIGDGSLTGGMAFEGLNHLATESVNAIIIINDNNMSIDPNVGGLQHHLNTISPEHNIFTTLGLSYHGVFDGNNVHEVIDVLKNPKLKNGVHVIHFRTKKGFGYRYSEDGNPTHWHAPGKFEVGSGEGSRAEHPFPKKYQEIVGETLCEVLEDRKNAVVITPAMTSGSGLNEVRRMYPDRFFDVGIAEQHAVTFSAGLATKRILPYCVIYSTFLQRAYDQLIHDVALQNLKVVFLIDRAGLVGNDGATHHGAFDLVYLQTIPNLTLFAPADECQLKSLVLQSADELNGPVAIRYPRGRGVIDSACVDVTPLDDLHWRRKHERANKLVISIGAIGNLLTLNEEIDHLQLIKVKPVNINELMNICSAYDKIVWLEDGAKLGGVAESLTARMVELGSKNQFKILALPDQFISHGSQEELYESVGLGKKDVERLIANF